jgi:hypothetical protein
MTNKKCLLGTIASYSLDVKLAVGDAGACDASFVGESAGTVFPLVGKGRRSAFITSEDYATIEATMPIGTIADEPENDD